MDIRRYDYQLYEKKNNYGRCEDGRYCWRAANK